MKSLLLIVPIFFVLLPSSFAQPIITFQPLATTLSQPLDIANANDGRMYIVEKAGTIRIWTGTALLPTPFLNITTLVRSTGSEQGLLSVAFHPQYAANGYFYVYYTNLDGDVVVARYTRSTANAADPGSGVTLMTIYQPYANHNGGKLNFGPDGFLYFGTGDGGSGGDPGDRAQHGDSILGKMVRIDVNNPNPPYYSIPATNPYTTNPAIRDDIIALGLRNPWRWSFDKLTGDMWLPDVGQNQWEEVNFVPAANVLDKNFGWNCYEGTHVFDASCTAQPNNVFPIFEYPHNNTTGGFSITGGYMYRGTEYPFLQGYYLVADYVSGNGWLISSNGSGGWNTTMQDWINGISSFGEDENGNLYAVTLGGGTLYKIVAADPLPVRLVSFTATLHNNLHQLNFSVQNEERGDEYIVEKRHSPSSQFEEASATSANTNNSANSYKISLPSHAGKTYYRLKIISTNRQVHYSHVVMLTSREEHEIIAVISGGSLIVKHPAGSEQVMIYDATGRLFQTSKLSPNASQTSLSLQAIPKGIVTIVLINNGERLSTQIVH